MPKKYHSCFFCNSPLQLLYALQIINKAFKNKNNIIFYDGPETYTKKNDHAEIVNLQKSKGSFNAPQDQQNGSHIKSLILTEKNKFRNSFDECIFLFPNICWPINNFLFFKITALGAIKKISFYYEGIGSYLSHKQSWRFRIRNHLKSLISRLSQKNTFNAYSGNFMYGEFSQCLSFYGPSIGKKKAKFKNYNCIELPSNLFKTELNIPTNRITDKKCLILGWSAKSNDEQLTFIKKAKIVLSENGMSELVYKPHPLQREDHELLLKITTLGLTIIDSSDAVERLYDPAIHAAVVSPFSSSLLHIKSRYPESRCIAIIDSNMLKKGAKFGALHEDEIRTLFTSMEIEVHS